MSTKYATGFKKKNSPAGANEFFRPHRPSTGGRYSFAVFPSQVPTFTAGREANQRDVTDLDSV